MDMEGTRMDMAQIVQVGQLHSSILFEEGDPLSVNFVHIGLTFILCPHSILQVASQGEGRVIKKGIQSNCLDSLNLCRHSLTGAKLNKEIFNRNVRCILLFHSISSASHAILTSLKKTVIVLYVISFSVYI
jgi:hypothetical protein